MLQLELGKTIRSTTPTMPRAMIVPWRSLAVIIALVMATGAFRSWLLLPTPAQQISFNPGHSITLLRSGSCATGFHLLYTIDNGKSFDPVPLPDACACFGINYGSLQTKDGQVVAIVDHASPQRILVLHNFSTGEFWPSPTANPKSDETAKRLLARLLESNPDEDLVLMPNR